LRKVSRLKDPRITRVFRLLADANDPCRDGSSQTPYRHLLPSYNVAVTPISKTYVQRGILQLGATRRLLFFDPSQSSFPERATVAPGNKRDNEHLMLDVFFWAAVGYAHACERL